jgi:hypothetical protein
MKVTIPYFPRSITAPADGRIFNDDLLTNSGDLQYAKQQFPSVFPLLDHSELRNTFARYESVANSARAQVRRLGLFAVVSGAVALLSTATEPLWHQVKYEAVLTIVFELCGLIGAVIAGGSLWLGPWRKRWLESRFMTERLRQWHFQVLLRKGAEIETLLSNPNVKALESFKTERQKWFDDFLHEHEGKLGSRMDSLASDPDFSGEWLFPIATCFGSNSQALPHLFEAYSRLRFNHQYDYATHLLSEATDRPFWEFLRWPPLRQQAAIQGAVSFCFIAALLCSSVIILNRVFEIRPSLGSYLGIVALVVAVIGVALRTIQAGLGISKDIERYRDYRGKVHRLFSCFKETADQHKRLRMMEELELAAVDELKGFLRTHRDAAFVL